MSTATPLVVSHDISLLQDTIILRHVTVSVYVVLVLEHLSSFPQEVEFVWKAPGSLVRICFLSYRYGSVFGLAILMYLLADLTAPMDEKDSDNMSLSCKQAMAAVASLSVFTMGIADALVMLRVSVLWGRQRFVLVLLLISFAVTFSAAVVCVAIVATQLSALVIVAPSFNVNDCHFPSRPNAVFGIWIPGMFFDGLVLSLAAWNACARPRTRETALTAQLYRDGVFVFLSLASLRAVNLFMSIFTNVFLLTVCIAWPLAAITLSRFIFRLHRLEKKLASASVETGIDLEEADTQSIPCSGLEASGCIQGCKMTATRECRRCRPRNDNPRPLLQTVSKDQDDEAHRDRIASVQQS